MAAHCGVEVATMGCAPWQRGRALMATVLVQRRGGRRGAAEPVGVGMLVCMQTGGVREQHTEGCVT